MRPDGLDHRLGHESAWMPAFAGMTGAGLFKFVIPAKAGIQCSYGRGRNGQHACFRSITLPVYTVDHSDGNTATLAESRIVEKRDATLPHRDSSH